MWRLCFGKATHGTGWSTPYSKGWLHGRKGLSGHHFDRSLRRQPPPGRNLSKVQSQNRCVLPLVPLLFVFHHIPANNSSLCWNWGRLDKWTLKCIKSKTTFGISWAIKSIGFHLSSLWKAPGENKFAAFAPALAAAIRRDEEEIAKGTKPMLFTVLFYYLFKLNRGTWGPVFSNEGGYDVLVGSLRFVLLFVSSNVLSLLLNKTSFAKKIKTHNRYHVEF